MGNALISLALCLPGAALAHAGHGAAVHAHLELGVLCVALVGFVACARILIREAR